MPVPAGVHKFLSIDGNLRLYRYGGVVFDKRGRVADINDHISLGLSGAVTDEIAARHDIFPNAEGPKAHIRQVNPGNYRKHLSKPSISRLNRSFAGDLNYFGYEL